MHLESITALAFLANAAAASFECGNSGEHLALRADLSAPLTNKNSAKGNIEVITYAHVIAASNEEVDGYITQETVEGQLDLLNEHYNKHGFSFKLLETTRTINSNWSDPAGNPVKPDYEGELMEALRQGTYRDLNLYFIRDAPYGGKCEYPVPDPSDADIANDGCIMKPSNVGETPPEFGMVTVHEVGHWLGLYHTFENGCDFPGDHVDDTPYEDFPVGGDSCAEPGRNTCPEQPGLDPVDNVMTYVSPECGPQKFTPGQVERMRKLWSLRE